MIFTRRSLLSLSVVLCLSACRDETTYRVLSFFFDGVPLPPSLVVALPADTTRTVSTVPLTGVTPGLARTNRAQVTWFLHEPYKGRNCNKCHQDQSGQSLLATRTDFVCRTCHEQFARPYAYIHGPVAVGQCLACHDPHRSRGKKLLTRNGDKICTFCHEKIDRERVTAHVLNENRVCIECHSPHFSDRSQFLPREGG
ncbi:MAG: cytochrome c3 family protein [Candidatus Neomarinimicrobiota bacterium]